MGKLKETDFLIDFIMTKLKEPSPNVVKTSDVALLADIAKSLAMIADKLCDTESEDRT